ncbi:MAG: glycosyltransferase [Gammaproteobacteria bacterium]|nr:glycosyltransferase [Gammaproteobacteria bacterium]
MELGREYGVPVVLTEHSSGFARGLYKRWQHRLASSAAAGAARRIAVSPTLGGLLKDRLRGSVGDWEWVPNVVAERFQYDLKDVDRDQGRPLRFLSLAFMTQNKGQLDLLHGFATAFPSGHEELWLGGDGPLRSQLRELAKELGVSDRVRFVGMIDPEDVPSLLMEIDVMVVSSHYETFGLVAAEALMAGRPVVATRCGGPECIVREGDGVLVPVRSPAKLGEGMRLVAENLGKYPADELRRRAWARFSGESIAAQLTRIYEDVTASSANVRWPA